MPGYVQTQSSQANKLSCQILEVSLYSKETCPRAVWEINAPSLRVSLLWGWAMGSFRTKATPASFRLLSTLVVFSPLKVKYSGEQFFCFFLIGDRYQWIGNAVLLGELGSIQAARENYLECDGFFQMICRFAIFYIHQCIHFWQTNHRDWKASLTAGELSSNRCLHFPYYKLFHNTYPISPLCIHLLIHLVHSSISRKDTITCQALGSLWRY